MSRRVSGDPRVSKAWPMEHPVSHNDMTACIHNTPTHLLIRHSLAHMEKKEWEATNETTFELPNITKIATTQTHDGQPATNPADPLFHIPINTVTYQVSAFGIGNTIGSLLWTPVADTYGRRPVYLFAGLTSVLAAIASSFASSFGGYLIATVFRGLSSFAPTVLTAISIAGLFPLHERGAKIGIWIYLIHGCYVFVLGILVLIPQVYPPLYGFDSRQTGLAYFGLFLGSQIGEIFAGRLSDTIIVRRTRLGGAIFEPAMRLYFLPLGVISLTTGLLLWGIFVDIKTPWYGPVIMEGVV
ncbi:hypothetical protein Clacol_009596 [Clathrus columnatus]|uniref:Major facilitator superfamily (MFS) profile domain-containing protein n=1 Tax=Clathrus columnatus TaxID=1419009 RepID=A0AAV5ARB8_9AGAM|nr:hypothetical protein Clacol_009596 [Clathrus columnatus]